MKILEILFMGACIATFVAIAYIGVVLVDNLSDWFENNITRQPMSFVPTLPCEQKLIQCESKIRRYRDSLQCPSYWDLD